MNLLLNHTFLIGIGDRLTRDALSLVFAVNDAVLRYRRVVGGHLVLWTHPDVCSADAAGQDSIARWMMRRLHDPSWGDIAKALAITCTTGPFITDLAVDDLAPPVDSNPSSSGAPAAFREITLRGLHHLLSFPESRARLLSLGDDQHLIADSYKTLRQQQEATLLNHRHPDSVRAALDEEQRFGLRSTSDVLEAAARAAERVIVLEPARRSARRWPLDCEPDRLFDAIVHLDSFARALDQGSSREQAAEEYQKASSVQMSQEKAMTLAVRRLKRMREFDLPDGSTKLFDMHAKPGSRTRVHVFAGVEERRGKQVHVVYIGHCGEHLPVK